jgi:hypothetical protein
MTGGPRAPGDRAADVRARAREWGGGCGWPTSKAGPRAGWGEGGMRVGRGTGPGRGKEMFFLFSNSFPFPFYLSFEFKNKSAQIQI